jgi:hypothetical protein
MTEKKPYDQMSREEKQQELYELVTRNFQLADEMKRQKSEVRAGQLYAEFVDTLTAIKEEMKETARNIKRLVTGRAK